MRNVTSTLNLLDNEYKGLIKCVPLNSLGMYTLFCVARVTVCTVRIQAVCRLERVT